MARRKRNRWISGWLCLLIVDFYKTNDGRSAVFVALIDRRCLEEWQDFARALERGEIRLAGE